MYASWRMWPLECSSVLLAKLELEDPDLFLRETCADPEGGHRVRAPPEKSRKYRVPLQITGPNPLKNHKATKPAFNFGPSSACQGNAMLMAFRWRADDGPFIEVFGSSIPSLTKNKRTMIKFGPPLTKLFGSVH